MHISKGELSQNSVLIRAADCHRQVAKFLLNFSFLISSKSITFIEKQDLLFIVAFRAGKACLHLKQSFPLHQNYSIVLPFYYIDSSICLSLFSLVLAIEYIEG
jgi:hypothetical protein